MKLNAMLLSIIACVGVHSLALAGEIATEPRPIPLTRPEMKQLLEDMKSRTPRIPLPEPTAEEKEAAGERGMGYEGRLRYHYLPGSRQARGGFGGFGSGAFGFSREPDPKMTLDYAFKVRLFWIVSRTNNCQYCLGHQESKLLAAGMTEDQIAALDGDWGLYSPAEQAAFAFARKLTYEPHLLDDADIDQLRPHFSDLRILEMVMSIAGNNAINRWKEGVGVPQSQDGGNFGRRNPGSGQTQGQPGTSSEHQSYLTPTSEKYLALVTKVAPVTLDGADQPTALTRSVRPALESSEEANELLNKCRSRTPRLPLVDEAEAREVLGDAAPEGVLPQWALLLANFPQDGKTRILSQWEAEERGDLSPLLKAQIRWILARQDRAWYALGLARQRLMELGQSEADIQRLDGDWSEFTPAERSQFVVASKLATTPVVLTDADVAEAVHLAGPRDVVQLVSYVTVQASFNRITEAAGLPLEK
jgi:alkylhydroperoxidase family enzyme